MKKGKREYDGSTGFNHSEIGTPNGPESRFHTDFILEQSPSSSSFSAKKVAKERVVSSSLGLTLSVAEHISSSSRPTKASGAGKGCAITCVTVMPIWFAAG